MPRSCPHCGGEIPTAPLLRSASGVTRYFDCQRCLRRLSVRTSDKIVYAGVLALTLVTCCAYDLKYGNPVSFLWFPIVAALATLAVCRRAKIRRFYRTSLWTMAINYGFLGLAVGAVSIASSQ